MFGKIIAVRPGNSRGLIPTIDNHQKVFDNPSNETVESTNKTNATPPVGKDSGLSKPAQGQRIEICWVNSSSFSIEDFQ